MAGKSFGRASIAGEHAKGKDTGVAQRKDRSQRSTNARPENHRSAKVRLLLLLIRPAVRRLTQFDPNQTQDVDGYFLSLIIEWCAPTYSLYISTGEFEHEIAHVGLQRKDTSEREREKMKPVIACIRC